MDHGAPIFCPRCGYSLTGLPDDYRCPECAFGYQRAAIEQLAREHVAARRILDEQIVLASGVAFAAAAFGATLAAAPRFSPRIIVLLVFVEVLAFDAYGVYRLIRHGPGEHALASRCALAFWNLLAVLTLMFPILLAWGAWVVMAVASIACFSYRPPFDHLEASADSARVREARRWRIAAWTAVPIGALSLLALI